MDGAWGPQGLCVLHLHQWSQGSQSRASAGQAVGGQPVGGQAVGWATVGASGPRWGCA
jgi:hypothetical protein